MNQPTTTTWSFIYRSSCTKYHKVLKEKRPELMNETWRKACASIERKLHLWPRVTVQESADTPVTHQTSAHMQCDWARIKDDAVNLALQELPDRKEKESLFLWGLPLAFGFVRVPDNVFSNLLQLLWVTKARPLLCHELSLLSSEANLQKSPLNKTTQTFTVLCCYYTPTDHPNETCWTQWKTNRTLSRYSSGF